MSVLQVHADHLIERDSASTPHLPQTGNAGLHPVPLGIIRDRLAQRLDEEYTGQPGLLQGSRLIGDADLAVEGGAAGFDENLYPRIARVPGVAVASPVVEVSAKLVGRRGALTLLGLDGFRSRLLQPAIATALVPASRDAADQDSDAEPKQETFDDRAVTLSASAARAAAFSSRVQKPDSANSFRNVVSDMLWRTRWPSAMPASAGTVAASDTSPISDDIRPWLVSEVPSATVNTRNMMPSACTSVLRGKSSAWM